MHTTATYCTVSGMLATEYCPADQTEERTALVIPTGSQLAEISESLLKETMPSAIFGLSDASQLSYLTEEQKAEYCCTVHTAQSGSQTTQDEINYAESLIALARYMADSTYDLNDDQKAQLTALADELEEAISSGWSAESVASLSSELHDLCSSLQEDEPIEEEEDEEELWIP